MFKWHVPWCASGCFSFGSLADLCLMVSGKDNTVPPISILSPIGITTDLQRSHNGLTTDLQRTYSGVTAKVQRRNTGGRSKQSFKIKGLKYLRIKILKDLWIKHKNRQPSPFAPKPRCTKGFARWRLTIFPLNSWFIGYKRQIERFLSGISDNLFLIFKTWYWHYIDTIVIVSFKWDNH